MKKLQGRKSAPNDIHNPFTGSKVMGWVGGGGGGGGWWPIRFYCQPQSHLDLFFHWFGIGIGTWASGLGDWD